MSDTITLESIAPADELMYSEWSDWEGGQKAGFPSKAAFVQEVERDWTGPETFADLLKKTRSGWVRPCVNSWCPDTKDFRNAYGGDGAHWHHCQRGQEAAAGVWYLEAGDG